MATIGLLSHSPRTVAQKLLRVNWLIMLLLCIITAIGISALYSIAGGKFAPWAERHAVRFVICVGLALTVAVVPIRLWLALAYPAYLIALTLLALVPLIGIDALGARRWLGAGGISFQPSELMKIALVIMLARYYQWLPPERVSSPLWVALPLIAITAPVALTLKQPDLGTAVLFATVGLAMMFLAGVSWRYFVAGGTIAAVIAPVIFSRLHGYQRRRVEIFLNPESDPLGAGYHITQSKIALGSGGLTGKGFMQGTQSQLDFLPEKHTDFIFTMFAEEWGFAGSVVTLTLFVLLLLIILQMAFTCRHQFGRMLIAGMAMIVFIYAFINIAMVTGLVPVVGVPLPLVSYGGTSMTTIMIGLGLAMCADVHKAERIRREDLGRL